MKLAVVIFLILCSLQLSAPHSNRRNASVCSSWSTYDSDLGICICPHIVDDLLLCNESGYIHAVKSCACATFNEVTHEIEVGYCVYGCNKYIPSDGNVPVGYSYIGNMSEWNIKQCRPFERTGTLCGACMSGYYLPAYSYDMKCVSCTNFMDIWKYLLMTLIPLTVFYSTVLILKINVLSSSLYGLVFYSQAFSIPMFVRAMIINHPKRKYLSDTLRWLNAFYGIWNLDFFRSFSHGPCLRTNTLMTLSLELVVTFYPFLLMLLTKLIIMIKDRYEGRIRSHLMKPFIKIMSHCLRFNTNTSIIDALATFMLLFNVKLLGTCIDLLNPVDVHIYSSLLNVTVSRRLYYDATLQYMGSEHLPYAILALTTLSVFLLPVVILILYPLKTFQRLVNRLPLRIILLLNTFVDSFQGMYKNGTEPGTRDYRYVSALPFILHILYFLIYSQTLDAVFLPLVIILLTLVVMFVIVMDPLKTEYEEVSYQWTIYTMLLMIFCVAVAGIEITDMFANGYFPFLIVFTVASGVGVFLPFLCALLFAAQCLYKNRKIQKKMKSIFP